MNHPLITGKMYVSAMPLLIVLLGLYYHAFPRSRGSDRKWVIGASRIMPVAQPCVCPYSSCSCPGGVTPVCTCTNGFATCGCNSTIPGSSIRISMDEDQKARARELDLFYQGLKSQPALNLALQVDSIMIAVENKDAEGYLIALSRYQSEYVKLTPSDRSKLNAWRVSKGILE